MCRGLLLKIVVFSTCWSASSQVQQQQRMFPQLVSSRERKAAIFFVDVLRADEYRPTGGFNDSFGLVA